MVRGRITIPTYNKIVRDRIPEIIQSKGSSATFPVSGEEPLSGLKLSSRKNLRNSGRAGEAWRNGGYSGSSGWAGLHLGSSFDEVLELKRAKRQERGGFEQGILLEWVED